MFKLSWCGFLYLKVGPVYEPWVARALGDFHFVTLQGEDFKQRPLTVSDTNKWFNEEVTWVPSLIVNLHAACR